MDNEVSVIVIERRELIPGSIVELKLAPTAERPLAKWEPGAHVEIVLPSGLVRQYSLCGDPTEDFYTVAVLLEQESRGGSIEVHSAIGPGTRLQIRGPRNHFPLKAGDPTVFIAGGIGITPLLPMMRQLSKEGRPWSLHYGGKSLAALAYLDALQLIGGHEVNIYLKDETRRIPVSAILAELPKSAVVYVCGPESMIVDVETVGNELGIEVHLERFGPSSKPIETDGDAEFEVTLAKSGKTLLVPVDTRLIDVVRTVVPSVPFSCEEGYCGSCETGVIEGEPEHRDSILSDAEKAQNDCMMICVGRSKSPRLVLDL